MLTREKLQELAAEHAISADFLEKVSMLIRLLNGMSAHPFIGPRVALKGGTALNLFVLDLPRLSVDIDINYIGSAEMATMNAERDKLDAALVQTAARYGLSVKRAPSEHIGGKWRLSYTSVLGRPSTLEVDINYLLRVPLWEPELLNSRAFLGDQAKSIKVLNTHELAAGKLAALLSRGAVRDIFDARLLLDSDLDQELLRLAFVVYGGINRVDWRTISSDAVKTSSEDVRNQLLPSLNRDFRPELKNLKSWTNTLVEETRELLKNVLPFTDAEYEFLDRLNGRGEIAPSLITSDPLMQQKISANPGLKWKALNVQKHIRGPKRPS